MLLGDGWKVETIYLKQKKREKQIVCIEMNDASVSPWTPVAQLMPEQAAHTCSSSDADAQSSVLLGSARECKEHCAWSLEVMSPSSFVSSADFTGMLSVFIHVTSNIEKSCFEGNHWWSESSVLGSSYLRTAWVRWVRHNGHSSLWVSRGNAHWKILKRGG